MSPSSSVVTPRVIVQMLFFVVLIPLLPLLLAGRGDWWEAWVYAFISIVAFVISRTLAARRNPDLIAERARFVEHEDTKPWDKVLAPLLALGGILTCAVIGLDVRANGTGLFSPAVKLVALVIMLAGWVLSAAALIENRYFSGVVRIQRERDHHVIASGPYRWLRHPGYAGGLLTYLATPFFLDSLWGFVPALLLTLVLIIRTALEDQTLQAELEGYHAYAAHTRYRLLPGIW